MKKNNAEIIFKVGVLFLSNPEMALRYYLKNISPNKKMARASLGSTVCFNIKLKVAKTTINFCQRNLREYPKSTYMHWKT